MFTHWASGEESGGAIDLVLTAFGSRGPKDVRLVCVEEVGAGASVSFSRNVKLFLVDVQPFRVVLVGDLDLDRVRFLGGTPRNW